MANKKKDTVSYAVAPTEVEDVTPVVDAHDEDVSSKDEVREIPTNIWHSVEHSSRIDTFAMNLPIGCLVMTVIGGSKPVMQYVAGIRYDETSKRFSV